jgi:acyl-[acyl carrier protein]--UDP-N-acetylglucosamine O-acyltransferase
VRGVNKVGLRRRAIPEASVDALSRAVRTFTRPGAVRAHAIQCLRGATDPYVARLVAALASSAP